MLSDREILNLYSVAKGCYEIKNLVEFREFVRTKIREVFPHEIASCYIATAPDHRLSWLINIDFPDEYLHGVIRDNREIHDPITMWLRRETPLFIRVDEVNEVMDPAWVQLARKHNIQTIASHGLLDVGGSFFSYFSFGRIHPSVHDKYKEYLNLLIPHLHITLVRQLHSREQTDSGWGSVDSSNSDEVKEQTDNGSGLVGSSNSGEVKEASVQNGLTPRERQTLAWVCIGKTNWEISRILDISENTVKNHVQNIYKKLDVTNRTQAAEKARGLAQTQVLGLVQPARFSVARSGAAR